MPGELPIYDGGDEAPIVPDTWGYDDERRRARLRETRPGAHLNRPVRILAKFTMGAVMPASILASAYWTKDVLPERERLEGTHAEIIELYGATNPSDNDVAVVDFVGLGNLSAEKYVETLSSYAEMGRGWAVRYDNQGIDTTAIAESVHEKALQEDVTDIVITGHSMGGLVALEVAQYLYEKTDRQVSAVILDGTPLDIDAVRPESRERGMEMARLVGSIPGARESRVLRGMVEMAARREQFIEGWTPYGLPNIDPSGLRRASQEVYYEKLSSEDAASTRLIGEQFRMILASGAADNLRALSKRYDRKQRPAIVFIRPRTASDDPIVDVDRTLKILRDTVPSQLHVIFGDGIQHANPVQRPDEYRPIMGTIVTLVHEIQKKPERTTTDLAQQYGR